MKLQFLKSGMLIHKKLLIRALHLKLRGKAPVLLSFAPLKSLMKEVSTGTGTGTGYDYVTLFKTNITERGKRLEGDKRI